MEQPTGLALYWYSLRKQLFTPTPYLMVFGILLWLGTWWLFCEVWELPRFEKMPGPVRVLRELFAVEPFLGISIFTAEFYEHVWVSCRRIFFAFCIATGVGVPLGLFMGWSRTFRDYTFPILETVRPIPILAWVPLAILMFPGFEAPVIFLATLASCTSPPSIRCSVSTRSTSPISGRQAVLARSLACLLARGRAGVTAVRLYRSADQHRRGVVLTGRGGDGLGDYGLGYLIVDAYMNNVTVPMVIGMITLGFVGWGTSA